jgi:hypothetical protein
MEELIWSNGEKYEKSLKYEKPNLKKIQKNNNNNNNNNNDIDNFNNFEQCENAIMNNISNDDMFLSNNNNEIFRINNKREEANHKLSERYLVGQTKQNPFMLDNDYIKDLDTQQNFLIPKNSNNNE